MHRSVSVEGFQLRHGIADKFFHLVPKLTIDYHMQQLWQGLAEELLCKMISQLLKAYKVVWGCFIWIQGELIFAVNFRLVPCIHGMDGFSINCYSFFLSLLAQLFWCFLCCWFTLNMGILLLAFELPHCNRKEKFILFPINYWFGLFIRNGNINENSFLFFEFWFFSFTWYGIVGGNLNNLVSLVFVLKLEK